MGGLDAIVDVVGTCAALEVLEIDALYASVVVTGTGMVRAAHGLLPNPAPAVVELLAAVGAPTRGLDLGVELTTPTGAALVAALGVRLRAAAADDASTAAASAPAPATSTVSPTPPRW